MGKEGERYFKSAFKGASLLGVKSLNLLSGFCRLALGLELG